MKLKTLFLATSIALTGASLAHEINEKHEHVEGGYMTSTGLFVSTTDHTSRMWDPTGKSFEEITERIGYLVKMSDPYTAEEREAFKAIKARYQGATVVDMLQIGTVGFAGLTEAKWIEMMGYQAQVENGFTLVSQTATNGDITLMKTHPFENVKNTNKAMQGTDLTPILDIQDVLEAKAQGKTGVMYNIQGSDFIDENNMEVDVAGMVEHGILQANITYNVDNKYGGGLNKNFTEDETGLTEAGIKLVEAYNRHGIVVDCTHSSEKVCMDIAKYSKKPVMISHSNAYELQPITRNVTDKAILAVAKTDGVIGVNFLGGFLNNRGDARGEDIAQHVAYIADLITKELGIDGKRHVGFGADTVHTYADALEVIVRNPDRYSIANGYGSVTEQALPTDVWDVARVLEEDYGWTQDEVKGFLGENALRVYKANWK